ncbi:carbohydrate kinase family protein [Flavobacterium aquatile]|uniref:Carbohydrate kinase n=1 Tax=Flavobacterium aquatile LMG 4008 = ATCC 11947 TaxID=1453498 RepID=A0A095V2X9_9FLAO|nr:carbohydrate kinase family protein [Flavobacterium aquatile]KGD69180.1 carbohydrate kinase [Flavobacterium aquatile LMG 4008 = ATCC 11947]OXA65884.1 carbohydrate kinase [Flavobacterium aquatile] [Flavobacterium aquatile LMG 4008 = ATCC 11947]GEC79654.1 putative sugar kinase YdjE [Flavobacterium aquatile]
MKSIDIISIGEVLIDFIGHEINTSINRTKDYHRFLGGSPTNVAVNASRLGLKSVLVASCGQDGLGDYVVRKLKSNNVDTSSIRKSDTAPTSVIFVSKSTETPDFIPYRQADCEIFESQLSDATIADAKIFHTTCFALSKNPARQTILNRARKAKELGLKLSIDINFSERIWPDREEAKQVLKEYLANDPLVKLSEDDCYRLFAEVKSEDYIFDYFHNLGASTICLTKGKNGVALSDVNEGLLFQKAMKIDDIKDTTGAGDAFWTGFLFAQIENKSLNECITIAQKLASIKLQNVGRLPDNINIKKIIQE